MSHKNSEQPVIKRMKVELPKGAQDYVRQTRADAARQIQVINARVDEQLRAYLSGLLSGIDGTEGKLFDLNPEGTALEEKEPAPIQNE